MFTAEYDSLVDRPLAAALAIEDAAERRGGLNPFERTTCRTHRRWIHQCIGSPAHVVVVTGYRWCRRCRATANVAVDELSGSIEVTCTKCGRTPDGLATRQIIESCRASIARARNVDFPVLQAA